MNCPECGSLHGSPNRACPVCGKTKGLPAANASTTPQDEPCTIVSSEPVTSVSPSGPSSIDERITSIGSSKPTSRIGSPLEVGKPFGNRYHIHELLGIGGMGAVYKAFDQELGIPVALKVIRPEAAADPIAAAELDQRFKREILLARQVTHKNVVRIHDLGNVDGIKYITMTYIEGETLAAKLNRDGPLTPEEALPIARSVVSGLVAAHEADVVHRDLKPSNIIIESHSGEAFIMDFGIARSSTTVNEARSLGSGDGFHAAPSDQTALGAVIGTLKYMAPEQFLGIQIDQRADVYAFGLVLYDLLIPDRLSKRADSAMAEFRARMEKAPPPTRSKNVSIPEELDRIISRCLDPEPEARFMSAVELEQELDRLDAKGYAKTESRLWTPRLVAVVASVFLLLLAATWWIASRKAMHISPEPMSVLIADFANSTGDRSFEGALEQTLTIAMEGAGFISAFSRPSALRIANQLNENARLDETNARLISRREGIGVILSGSIENDGGGYLLSVQALDPGFEPGQGSPLASARERAGSKDEVLATIADLASRLRGALGDTTPRSAVLAEAETYTAASLDAMRAYAQGQNLVAQGLFDQAITAYQQALQYDPGFGRAFAGLGVVYGNLHQEEKAEASYQEALKHLDRMSERERYRTLGGYYLLVSGNYEKAIESYSKLVELFPADGVGHSNLAYAFNKVHLVDRAVEAGRHSVELEPSNLIKRMNYAMYAMYAGDFTTAIAESKTVLEQNPDFGYAHFTLGRSAQAAGDYDLARQSYSLLGESQGYGSWLAPLGNADLAMYLGRPKEAAAILEPAVARLEGGDDPFTTASAMVALAEAKLALGELLAAAELASAATELSESESVLYPAARVLIASGNVEQAQQIASNLDNKLQSQTEAAADLIRGELALDGGRLGDAIRLLRESKEHAELWFSHFLLGRAYFAAEHIPEAYDEFDICVRAQGEVTDIFLVDGATLRYFPPAVYWLGRTSEVLGQSSGATAQYQRFSALRSNADTTDPLAEDTAARLLSN